MTPTLMRPPLAGTDATDVFLHAPEIEEKRAALAVERLSGLGELHAAALAGEKLHAELGFELGNLARDGRLGDVQGAGGGGNAAPLRDRTEVFKLANGHGNAPPDKLY